MSFCRVKIAILTQLDTKLYVHIMGWLVKWKFMKVSKALYFRSVTIFNCFLSAYLPVLVRITKSPTALSNFDISFIWQIVSDGVPCSGETPDIAWESFQKKGCPRVKLWHGKRYSCNIDGIEVYIGVIAIGPICAANSYSPDSVTFLLLVYYGFFEK